MPDNRANSLISLQIPAIKTVLDSALQMMIRTLIFTLPKGISSDWFKYIIGHSVPKFDNILITRILALVEKYSFAAAFLVVGLISVDRSKLLFDWFKYLSTSKLDSD